MDETEHNSETTPMIDLGERRRSWRVFVSMLRWAVACTAIVLFLLLLFRTHG